MDETALVPLERIEGAILVIRGHKVMLDRDLALLYDVEIKALNRAVKRNLDRFPADFMFQLTAEEVKTMRSQIVTADLRSQIVTSSSTSHGGRRYFPYAFTEHGAIMAANVLNTPRAIEVSVYVVRAFVRLRQILAGHKELAAKFDQLEQKVASHDEAIRVLVAAIRKLAAPAPDPNRRQIGFHSAQERK